MIIDRKLICDEVIQGRMLALQEQLLGELCATDSSSNDYLFDNNIKDLPTADDDKKKTITENLERLVKNQNTRITNIPYFERQIEFLQSILAKKE